MSITRSLSLLQAISVVSAIAIVLWTIGVPSLRSAEAANVIEFSDVISDSAPSVGADHTLTFTTPTGLAASKTITLTFADFDFTGFTAITDLSLTVGGDEKGLDTVAEDDVWGAVINGGAKTITFTSGSDVVDPDDEIIITVGGANQITNPAVGSYQITVEMQDSDTGATMVAIVESVKVTASVATSLEFYITGITAGDMATVNDMSIVGTSTPTTIDFGTVPDNAPVSAAQGLEVYTNAKNGFVVTVVADQTLTSANGAEIVSFNQGSEPVSPTGWAPPDGLIGSPNTYGHWGVSAPYSHSQAFGSEQHMAIPTDSANALEVFSHDGPADGTTDGIGTANVVYTVEVSKLQPAADDYSATLTYVATPTF